VGNETVEVVSEEHRTLVHEIVEWSSRKRLAHPLSLFLEMHLPLHNITHNFFIFSSPWIQAVLGVARADQVASLLSSRTALEYLRDELVRTSDRKADSCLGEGAHGRS
jgi:hypothetical protein